MPFTLSHAVAAAPLTRCGLVLSALVIGSFSPDLIYFIRLAPVRHFTHTFPGVFLFCLPAGMAVLWIYHRILKEPLAALLPGPLRHSLVASRFSFLPIRRLALLAASVTAGALTHLAWDFVTHESDFAFRLLPFLGMNVIDLGFEKVVLTRVLHHAGSLVGLVWIAFQAWSWVDRVNRRPNGPVLGRRDILRSGLTAFALVAGSGFLGLMYVWGQGVPVHDFESLRRLAVKTLIVSGAFMSVLLAAYGILWHVAAEYKANRNPSR